MPGLRILEKPWSMRLLVDLYRNGPAAVRELLSRLGASPNALLSRVGELESAGVLERYRVHRRGRVCKVVALTEKGRRLAELLVLVEELLDEKQVTA